MSVSHDPVKSASGHSLTDILPKFLVLKISAHLPEITDQHRLGNASHERRIAQHGKRGLNPRRRTGQEFGVRRGTECLSGYSGGVWLM